MDDYVRFWRRSGGWPDDLPGYTFLARAFDQFGHAIYPEWTGSEGSWAVTHHGPTPNMLNAALSQVDGDDTPAVAKLRVDFAEHEAAYARGIAVQRRIANLAESGELITGLAPRDGGALRRVQPEAGYWNLQRPTYLARFGLCMMSSDRPFSLPTSYRPSLPYSSDFNWVYVETASLGHVLASLTGQTSAASANERAPACAPPCEIPAPARVEEALSSDEETKPPISEAELMRQMTDYLRMFQDYYPPPDRAHAVVYIREACPSNFVAVKRVHRLRAEMAPDKWKESGRRARVESGG
jgi:hypothetical protein